MTHVNDLTKYTANFIDELANSGLTDVVISPGSRSTPLAMMVREHEKLTDWIIIDERSAAFFALGIAKRTRRPVALICTSGTAAANYYPAIIEAYSSRVPLVVLTTDRPHELRDIGAPQAIDQIHLYGNHVKWFHEMALPESTDEMLRYARRTASRAMHESQTGNKGPVHLNFPFREPLVPDFTIENLWSDPSVQQKSFAPVVEGKKQLAEETIMKLRQLLENNSRGLIVYGPDQDLEDQEAIIHFAKHWQLPIIADPLSQLRTGNYDKNVVIDSYDAILRDKSIRESLQPDFIIRFGAMPVSKMYLFYVQEHSSVPQFVIESDEGYREPANQSTTFLYTDPKLFCENLLSDQSIESSKWLQTWQKMNAIVYGHITKAAEPHITEGEAIRGLHEVIPTDSTLFVANSMAIRDVDTFFIKTHKNIHILANRGVNGIDGVTSSALGAAAKSKRLTLVIGDLSFYHDLNGLLTAKHYHIDMTVILVNNDGGGIFSYLPQAADPKHFEALFGTPLGIDFKPVIEMYGAHYELIDHEEKLKKSLINSYKRRGVSVIEVQTERTENAIWHRNIWRHINQDLLELLSEGEM